MTEFRCRGKLAVVWNGSVVRQLAPTRADLLIVPPLSPVLSPGFLLAVIILSSIMSTSFRWALVQRQQVVIPASVCIGAHIGRLPCLPDKADAGTSSIGRIHHVERVGFGVDVESPARESTSNSRPGCPDA